jgi:hypothetical protein
LVCFVWCAENEEFMGKKGEKKRRKKKTQEESEENKVL